MNTTLEYDKKLVRKPVGLMLVLCGIPVYIFLSFFDYGHNDFLVVQICFGYMWLWFMGVIIYWYHKKIFTSTWQYALLIVGLIFNGLVVVFIPYLFSDAFTDLFWN